MDQGSATATRHSTKACNTKRTGAGGIRFIRRTGHAAYVEYGGPFALEYSPSIEGALESIQCRMGESFITIEGRNLTPIFEDMQARKCDQVRESDQDQAGLGVLYVETITVRLYL